MSGATPPPEAPLVIGTRYRVSRCRVCGDAIAAAGRRGPRRSICDRERCRRRERGYAYLAAAIRELEAAEDTGADELRELLERFRRDDAAIAAATRVE
jgi:hypothetical protein